MVILSSREHVMVIFKSFKFNTILSLNNIIRCLALFCVLMSIGTMLLWGIHRIDLVIFNGTTMFFNTALCIFLLSVGLFLLTTRFVFISAFIGLFIGIFSSLILSQDIFSIDLKLDQLFVDFYYPIPDVPPGRMSVQSSIDFILMGSCLCLLGFPHASLRKMMISLILISLLIVTTIGTSFGFLLKYSEIYNWVSANPISINTVISVILLSIGLLLSIFQTCLRQKINLMEYVHFVIFFGVAGIAFLLWERLTHQAQSNIKQINHSAEVNVLENFKATLDAEINSLDPVIFRMSGLPSNSLITSWKQYAQNALQKRDYIQYIGLFTEDFKEVSSTSLTPISINPEDFKKYASNEHISISDPVKLNSKQSSLLIIYPVIAETFKGYIVRAIDTSTLITLRKNFSYILLGNNIEVLKSTLPVDKKQAFKEELKTNLYGKEWKLQVWPTSEFLAKNRSFLPEITFFVVLLFGFLLAYSFRVALLARRRSQELKRMQADLLSAHQIANLGGWRWNLRDDAIYFTEIALRMLGLDIKQEVLPADQFFYLIHPTETEVLKKAISEMRSGRSGYAEIYTFIRPDKEIRQIRFVAEVSAFDDHYPVEISGILQDVTKLRALEEDLQQFQKMELIGQLTGGIAHDFNNILMIIQGNLELLSLFLDKTSKEYKKVEIALTACLRGSALTKRLLTFARRDSLHPEVIHLKTYLENFEPLLRATISEFITISLEVEDDISLIKIDPNQFESALLNIAINARDAMGQGGMLKIQVENVTIDQIDIFKKEKIPYNDYVKISVSDTGSGIPQDVLKRIFEPFFTTKAPTKGTGLGLSMVKGFVEQSHGYIRISSKVGVGTTVRIYFATILQEKVNLRSKKTVNDQMYRGIEAILMAEDETDVRETTAEYLRSLGYTVLEAKNGDEAFDIFKKTKQIDLVFTDVVMPGKRSGRDLVEEVLKLNPDMKILFASGYPDKAKSNGHNLSPLIIKPYKLIELAITLRRLLESRS